MNRTEKDHTALITTSCEIARSLGQTILALGSNIGHVAIAPKNAAQELLHVAEQLDAARSRVLDLANAIIDWEQSVIKHVEKKLVDANGNPIQ